MRRQSHRETCFDVLPGDVVRDRIARALLPSPNETDRQLGDVKLQPHQQLGVQRLRDVIARHRGALLADEVGLGKTYTALGVARHFRRGEIVAPAALRAMWHEAASRAHVPLDFISSESLSRADAGASAVDIVIVDEAHWFRNPATRRYRRLAHRYRRAAMLLLSATPLHNRQADLQALFGLFLGREASRLTPRDIGALTVRRGRIDIAMQASPPRVLPTEWRRVRCDARVIAALENLEPPMPVRRGDVAMALLRLTLLHRLSSSRAALRLTLKRLLSRALALLHAANSGRYPTASELRAWLVADDAIQLTFAELVTQPPADQNEAVSRDAIERHIASVRGALAALDASPNQDTIRARFLEQLARRFPTDRIVAFSQYEATVTALARALRRQRGVAALSAQGGRIASGRISRQEVLRQFDAGAGSRVSEAQRIDVLLTTDLLSEGVNLHNARVIVHLDLPWTPARLEQRVGRLSRLGSPHESIHVFGFYPPSALERVEHAVARLRAKWRAGRRRFGDSALLVHDGVVTAQGKTTQGSNARDTEEILRLMEGWLGTSRLDSLARTTRAAVAYVTCDESPDLISLALIRASDGPMLIAVEGAKPPSVHPAAVLRVANRLSRGDDCVPVDEFFRTVVRQLRRYLARRRGEDLARSNASGAAIGVLQARIARTIARLPRSARPDALRVWARIRAAVSTARSAGDNALLAEMATRLVAIEAADPVCWLAAAYEDVAASFSGDAAPHVQDNWAVDAILIGS